MKRGLAKRTMAIIWLNPHIIMLAMDTFPNKVRKSRAPPKQKGSGTLKIKRRTRIITSRRITVVRLMVIPPPCFAKQS